MAEDRPRIALLLPRLSLAGGVERQAYGLAQALAAEDMAVDFICARQEAGAPAGVRVVQVGRRGLCRAGKALWFALAAERARRTGRYDLSVGLGKTLAQDVLRVSGGPQAAFLRNSIRAYAPGLPRLAKRFTRRASPYNLLARFIEPLQLQRALAVVAVSHLNRDWLLEAYPWLDPDKVRVVYNRPDPERFFPAPDERRTARESFGMRPDHVVVAVAATSFMRKNLAACVRALADLPREYVLHVAGGRNPERFTALAEHLGVGDRVWFHGRVVDMPGFYRACDVFTLPTFHDTCSNAVLEALACGARVVGSTDDGSSHFLPPERVLADPSDHLALARLIREAVAAPADQPFAWPEDAQSGLAPLVRIVKETLG